MNSVVVVRLLFLVFIVWWKLYICCVFLIVGFLIFVLMILGQVLVQKLCICLSVKFGDGLVSCMLLQWNLWVNWVVCMWCFYQIGRLRLVLCGLVLIGLGVILFCGVVDVLLVDFVWVVVELMSDIWCGLIVGVFVLLLFFVLDGGVLQFVVFVFLVVLVVVFLVLVGWLGLCFVGVLVVWVFLVVDLGVLSVVVFLLLLVFVVVWVWLSKGSVFGLKICIVLVKFLLIFWGVFISINGCIFGLFLLVLVVLMVMWRLLFLVVMEMSSDVVCVNWWSLVNMGFFGRFKVRLQCVGLVVYLLC